jgi:(p)ppGpp synthase/HD superfamily hydrolase
MSSNLIFRAVEFATRAHTGQVRKVVKIPYIVHPLAVASILIEHGCRDELVAAGVLHDTIEDTLVDLEELRRLFGNDVARLVEGVSEPDHRTGTWEERKAYTIEHLRMAPMEILLLSSADKLDNIRTLRAHYEKYGDAVFNHFKRGKAEQAWYYRSIGEILVSRMEGEPSGSLFTEFQAEVQRLFSR